MAFLVWAFSSFVQQVCRPVGIYLDAAHLALLVADLVEAHPSLVGVDVVQRPAVARQACSYQPQSSVPIRGLTPLQATELVGRIRGLSKREARRRRAEVSAEADFALSGDDAPFGRTMIGGLERRAEVR